MPVYEYLCEGCGKRFDVKQSMTEEPLKDCPECRGKVKRLISGGNGFAVKGQSETPCGSAMRCCGNANPCSTPGCSR
ncbi:MAG: zinc ribbon domain-containing protein [Nitrospirales bacterium]|nr:zinc ribbon domain-containing protein [Nitrospirales bacterium]